MMSNVDDNDIEQNKNKEKEEDSQSLDWVKNLDFFRGEKVVWISALLFVLSVIFIVVVYLFVARKTTLPTRSPLPKVTKNDLDLNLLSTFVTPSPNLPLVESCSLHPVLYERILKDLSVWPVINNVTSDGIPLHHLKKCSMVLRIADQKLYILGKDAGNMRGKAMKMQIYSLLLTHRVPNVDICLHVGDWMHNDVDNTSAPVLVNDKHENQIHVLVPDFTFSSFPGPHYQSYELLQQKLYKYRKDYPWEKKTKKLFYRGNPNNWVRKKIGEFHVYNETFDVIVPNRNLDTKEAFEQKIYVPLEEHCNFTYLIHAEGLFYSSKLKYLMMCDSVVFWAHSLTWREKYIEFWYDLLIPWVNYIPIDPLNSTSVFEAFDWIRDDENRARKIAQESRIITEGVLSPWNVKCYWQKLLIEYASRMSYVPNSYQPHLEDIITNLSRGKPD